MLDPRSPDEHLEKHASETSWITLSHMLRKLAPCQDICQEENAKNPKNASAPGKALHFRSSFGARRECPTSIARLKSDALRERGLKTNL
jgi:hypothetical protein